MIQNTIHIAVLPFKNPNPETQYLSDGITEAVINKLASIPQLALTSRTSSYQFRDSNLGVGEIAKVLRVNALIEGSARFIQNRTRITANLIAPEQDEIIWSETWDREIEHIFDLENDVSESIAEKLREHHGHFDFHGIRESRNRITPDLYKLYLRANHLQFNWYVPDALEAKALYDQVIKMAPDFHDAYIFKINNYSYIRAQMAIPVEEADTETTRIIGILDKAEVRNADLFLAKSGYHFWGSWNFKAAFEDLQKALALNPSHSDAHNFLGLLYALSGKGNLATKHFSHAIQTDPLSANKYATQAWGFYSLGWFEEAIASWNEATRLNSKITGGGYAIKVKSRIALRRNLAALYQEVVENPEIQPLHKEGLLGLLAAHTGDKDAVARHSKNLVKQYEIEQNDQAPGFLMQINTQLRDYDQAIKWLEKSFESRDPMLVGTINDPLLANLHTYPEFQKIKERLLPLDTEAIKAHQPNKKRPSQEWILANQERVLRHMVEKKPYLDPAINLRKMASDLNIQANALSWLINNQMNQNFSDFINGYRVEAFKVKVADNSFGHLSLLGIAFECGFNSKATFNSVFKRMTGITPKAYQKQSRV